MEIYLVRHTSVNVPPGYNYGQTDVLLNDTFEAEAEKVKAELEGIDFDKVWTSPLTRCSRLAAFCGHADAEREERVKELYFGDWEMISFEKLSSDPRSEPWFEDWVNVPAPNGESLNDLFNRVSHFLDEIRSSGLNRVCIFAHGGVLTCANIYAGKYEIKEAFRKMPAYGTVLRFTFDE